MAPIVQYTTIHCPILSTKNGHAIGWDVPAKIQNYQVLFCIHPKNPAVEFSLLQIYVLFRQASFPIFSSTTKPISDLKPMHPADCLVGGLKNI